MKFWQSIAFAETDQLHGICALAEELGFEGVALAEHLVTPQTINSAYPYTPDGKVWWDPTTHWFDNFVLAGALAARTSRIKFVNSVVILPLRDPATAAKAIATAAYLSDNRIVLGVGVGWMKEEFELTGQNFHDRGKRMDEMIEVMRLLWTGEMVEHHGTFFDFPPMQMSPGPTQRVPIVIGGQSDAALRRAARNDGWFGADAYQPDVLLPLLDKLAGYRREYGRENEPFEILVGLGVPPTVDLLKRLRDRGATAFVNVPWYYQGTPTSTLEWKRAAMEKLRDELMVPLSESE
jgi:probable F420-dependent oxidoreductase